MDRRHLLSIRYGEQTELVLRAVAEHQLHDLDGALTAGQMQWCGEVMLLGADVRSVLQTDLDRSNIAGVHGRVQRYVALAIEAGEQLAGRVAAALACERGEER